MYHLKCLRSFETPSVSPSSPHVSASEILDGPKPPKASALTLVIDCTSFKPLIYHLPPPPSVVPLGSPRRLQSLTRLTSLVRAGLCARMCWLGILGTTTILPVQFQMSPLQCTPSWSRVGRVDPRHLLASVCRPRRRIGLAAKVVRAVEPARRCQKIVSVISLIGRVYSGTAVKV